MLESEPYIELPELVRITGDKRIGGKILYCGGRYMRNGHMLGGKLKHGEALTIDNEGRPYTHPDFDKETAKQYYFWNGWMCKDEEGLNGIVDLFKRGMVYRDYVNVQNDINVDRISQHLLGIVFTETKKGGWNYIAKGIAGATCFTGAFSPMFNQGKTYHFSNGFFENCVFSLEEKKEESTENSEREEIEGILKEAIDFIDISKTDLETIETKHEKNENSRIRILKWLSEGYDFLNDHWLHIKKETQEEEQLIY